LASVDLHDAKALRNPVERSVIPADWRELIVSVLGKLGSPLLRMHCTNEFFFFAGTLFRYW
jgi:hypothetical protein